MNKIFSKILFFALIATILISILLSITSFAISLPNISSQACSSNYKYIKQNIGLLNNDTVYKDKNYKQITSIESDINYSKITYKPIVIEREVDATYKIHQNKPQSITVQFIFILLFLSVFEAVLLIIFCSKNKLKQTQQIKQEKI